MRNTIWLSLFFITSFACADAAFDELMGKAESGDAQSQFQVGNMYINGDLASGVSKNQTRAIKWLGKAAEQGNAEAQTRLAMLYYKGDTALQNHKQALDLFTKAAESGDTLAQQTLAEMLRLGKGVPKNFQASYMWYVICCSTGSEAGNKKEVWKHLTDAEVKQAEAEAAEIQKKISASKAH